MPTGPLSLIGLAAVGALVMATLIGQRLGRKGLARVFSVVAIGLTAYSTNQIHSMRLAAQPFPDAQEVTEVTWRMIHGQGYTITLHGTGPRPPRYAPGYPIALAPFALMGSEFPGLIPRGAAFYAALYVVAVCLAARTMGGPAAGALAALVVGISPFARDMARMVMSDAFAAALTMLLIPLLHKPTRNRALWAGFLAGSLVAVRLPMVLNLAALFVALPRSLWSRAILAASIPLAAYAAFNHVTYGGPFTTGYHLWVPLKNFSLDYVTTELMKEGPYITPDALQGWIVKLIDRRPSSGWSPGGPQNDFPNYILYPAVLSGVFWVFTPPFLSLLGLWSYWRDRNRPEARFALVLCGISLPFFCCYFHQGTRFMAAPASALLAGAVTRIARWLAGDSSIPIGNAPVLYYAAPRSSRIRRGVTTDA
jgi:hypothetical protein